MILLSSGKVNLDAMKDCLGTVVTDGYYEYVVADFSLSNNTVQLWCKKRQVYYYVIPRVFDAMTCISG